jgi:site-specific recombinase XerC
MTDGKLDGAVLLTKSNGSPRGKLEQSHRIEACKVATIDPPISFHALRHSYAAMLAEAGTQLVFVADALGHTDTRMVGNRYAHLAPSYNHDSIRAHLPIFGADAKTELPLGSASASPHIVFGRAADRRLRTS